jgi:putative RNase toxin 15 of polymorphic toxin system
MIQANDPLVQEWTGIVKEVGDLAVLHDPDQIAGGHGDIAPLPVVKEPTDPNDSDGHASWRSYLAAVKSHLGVKDINGSLGSQWKQRIADLYNEITTDADCPQEAYPLRKVNAQFVPK